MTLTIGQTVSIRGGYSNKEIATGTVTRLSRTMATVATPEYAVPVRYRLTAPLKGRRITGGVAEHLNDWIDC